jgi:hypothetical protein
MALRIACDLDGTIADMDSALQREAEKLFGRDVSLRANVPLPLMRLKSPANFGADAPAGSAGDDDIPADPPSPGGAVAAAAADPDKKPLTDRQRRELWAHVRGIENFWFTLDEIEPGAVGRFARLTVEHGWEVLFLTQRPASAGEPVQLQTHRWLKAYGFSHPSIFVMNGSRGKVADALSLDAVIDDRSENCLDVATDSKARPLLVWRDDPATAPPGAERLGITVVHSFGDALEQLLNLMAERTPPPGILSRVRAAIGL